MPNKILTAGADILQVQRALAKLGFYIGPENGRLTSDTMAAIKFYQASADLTSDGKVTQSLLDRLEYALNIKKQQENEVQLHETNKSLQSIDDNILSSPSFATEDKHRRLTANLDAVENLLDGILSLSGGTRSASKLRQ